MTPAAVHPDTEEAESAAARRAHVVLGDNALVERDLGRYLFVLVTYLTLAGYRVSLRGTADLAARIGAQKWAGRLLDDPRVQIGETGSGTAGESDILVTDADDLAGAPAGLKTFRLVKGRRLARQPEAYDVLFPYMLHPKYYTGGRHLEVPRYRDQRRTIGLFFSGNYSARYRNPAILEKFGTLQRPVLLDLLLQGLPGDRLFRTSPEFDAELAGGHFREAIRVLSTISRATGWPRDNGWRPSAAAVSFSPVPVSTCRSATTWSRPCPSAASR